MVTINNTSRQAAVTIIIIIVIVMIIQYQLSNALKGNGIGAKGS